MMNWSNSILISDYTESSYNYEQYDENQYAPYDASYQQPTHNPNEVTDKTNKAMNENQDEKDQRQEMPSMFNFKLWMV